MGNIHQMLFKVKIFQVKLYERNRQLRRWKLSGKLYTTMPEETCIYKTCYLEGELELLIA